MMTITSSEQSIQSEHVDPLDSRRSTSAKEFVKYVKGHCWAVSNPWPSVKMHSGVEGRNLHDGLDPTLN